MITLFNGNCIDEMKKIPDGSVDLLLTDPPYGITQNKWDLVVPFDELWAELNRVVKPDGAMVFTAAQPFAAKLIVSNIDNFRYEIIWEKTIGSGQLNIKKQPLRVHESVLVFFRSQPTYNEQKTAGKPYSIKRKAAKQNKNYGTQKDSSKINDGFRHARSVIKIANPRIRGGHATQKPVALMEYLVKTFANPGQCVLDPFMGSGTTGEACINLGVNFIGIELNQQYFYSAKERLNVVKGGTDS